MVAGYLVHGLVSINQKNETYWKSSKKIWELENKRLH